MAAMQQDTISSVRLEVNEGRAVYVRHPGEASRSVSPGQRGCDRAEGHRRECTRRRGKVGHDHDALASEGPRLQEGHAMLPAQNPGDMAHHPMPACRPQVT